MKRKSIDQKARQARLELDGHECQLSKLFGITHLSHKPCNEKLHTHHITYERAGNEHVDDLITVCARCHTILTGAIRRGNAQSKRKKSKTKEKPWTDADTSILRLIYLEYTDNEIAIFLRRTTRQIRNHRRLLDLNRGRSNGKCKSIESEQVTAISAQGATMKRWTPAEHQVIIDNPTSTAAQLSDLIFAKCGTVRTPEAIDKKRRLLGLTCGWTEEQEQFVADHPEMTAKQIGDEIGKSESAVSQKRWRMKVRCDDCELESGCIEQPNTIGCNEYRKEHLTKAV